MYGWGYSTYRRTRQALGVSRMSVYFWVSGTDYVQTQPQVEALRQAIGHIFQAKTKRTAQKRYDQLLALRPQFVRDKAAAVAIFDFLERHCPVGQCHRE